MTEKPSPASFARAFCNHWTERMSGPLSVPIMLASLVISNRTVAIVAGIIGILAGVISSYRVWQTERNRVIELEKVDQIDLQHMLGGRFFGNTYVYPAVGALIKQYKTAFELEQLKIGYDQVPVRAPRKSIATIGFQFLNGHPENRDYAFYLRDGDGDEHRIDDIHIKQHVLLDEDASFGLKLVTGDAYQLSPQASLTVVVEAWTK